jgi:UDP-N-acetylglucosamine--N-acetylmuramyl-(pentapeptide) pyrophosphoryl-undecaprenol N-acetylglucosamine transferase
VTSADSRAFFPVDVASRVVETGYPVRPEVARAERQASRVRFGLPERSTVLLVFGGSRGARTLNEATLGEIEALLGLAPDLYVMHVCGREDEGRALERRSALAPALATRYHPFAYLHSADMAAALRASDLVVSRSGASTMGEFPAVGLPSVQVPYPYAGAHQRRNAEYLARRGAAVIVDNEAVRGGALVPTLRELLGDRARLARMADAARQLARADAARQIADQLVSLGEKR